jgi:hypothetical protein
MDKKKVSRRFFIGSGLAGTLVALEGGKVVAKKKEEKFPVGMQKSETIKESNYTLKIPGNPKSIQFLQFTDIHFNPYRRDKNIDKYTREDIKKIIDLTQPHLIAITGDVWNENAFEEVLQYLEQASRILWFTGCALFYTGGNHDVLGDYSKGMIYWLLQKNSMYRGGINEGNYEVVITTDDIRNYGGLYV